MIIHADFHFQVCERDRTVSKVNHSYKLNDPYSIYIGWKVQIIYKHKCTHNKYIYAHTHMYIFMYVLYNSYIHMYNVYK